MDNPKIQHTCAESLRRGNGNGEPDAAHVQVSEDLHPSAPTLTTTVEPPEDNGTVLPVLQLNLARHPRWLVWVALASADLVALVAAFLVAHWIFSQSPVETNVDAFERLFVLTLPVWFVALKLTGLYNRDFEYIGHSTLDEFPKLLQVSTMGVWSLLLLTWAFGRSVPSFGAVVFLWVGIALGIPTLRFIARFALQRRRGFPQRIVIVGAGRVGQLLARKLVEHPEYRVVLLGFVDGSSKGRQGPCDLPILGSPKDLPRLVGQLSVDRVVIAFSNESVDRTMELIRLLREHPARIDIVPRLFEAIPPQLARHTIEGVPLVTLPPLRRSRVLKRAFDLAAASIALLVLAPLFALVAFLIRLDSAGPVIIRQLRIGEGERPFQMLKFRTMTADADARKHEVAHLNAHLHLGGDARMFKIKRDPRVTRVGRVLRRYSLDELPQLINVLMGTMSLIGPRPLIPEEDCHVEDWGRNRLRMKPGMTGLWQVLGRSAIPFEEMVNLDYLYVTSWSFANDCRLLARTIPLVLRGNSGDC